MFLGSEESVVIVKRCTRVLVYLACETNSSIESIYERVALNSFLLAGSFQVRDQRLYSCFTEINCSVSQTERPQNRCYLSHVIVADLHA
jgi:hypothetical protein